MNKSLRNTFIVMGALGAINLGLDGILESYFHSDNGKEKHVEHSEEINELREIERPVHQKWFDESKTMDLSIRSYDGLNLRGCLIENNPSDTYILCTHGYKGNMFSNLPICHHLDSFGYNFLIHDCRASGASEGRYHTMGKMESLDLIAWISKLNKLRPGCKIVLYGVSMGASTELLALSTKLPDNVKCVISDCAFARFQDMVLLKAKNMGINILPFIRIVDLVMKERYNVSFKDVDVTQALKNNQIPVLFIHGKEDPVVDFYSMRALYNANTEGKRKYYPIDHAGHNECQYAKNYYNNINEFIQGDQL